jgi:hypothetical protein
MMAITLLNSSSNSPLIAIITLNEPVADVISSFFELSLSEHFQIRLRINYEESYLYTV